MFLISSYSLNNANICVFFSLNTKAKESLRLEAAGRVHWDWRVDVCEGYKWTRDCFSRRGEYRRGWQHKYKEKLHGQLLTYIIFKKKKCFVAVLWRNVTEWLWNTFIFVKCVWEDFQSHDVIKWCNFATRWQCLQNNSWKRLRPILL